MRVIVAGSRSITDYGVVKKLLDVINENAVVSTIISGCARGVDRLGERWAKENNIPVKRFPAEWRRYGRSAGYVRNELMASNADYLVAVWNDTSRGTENMIAVARKKGLKILVLNTRSGEMEMEA